MLQWFMDGLAEGAHGLYWPVAPIYPDNQWGRQLALVHAMAISAVPGLLMLMYAKPRRRR